MALPREISDRLFLLCDTAIEGGSEGLRSLIADMPDDETKTVLAEAVVALIDASERADKEIERFQRRLTNRGK
ncbi:MAG: hypothetical protein M3R12_04290 [Actinomycetota bacterium]|nr:hypothetical protein [Actinomycetota bacterium]